MGGLDHLARRQVLYELQIGFQEIVGWEFLALDPLHVTKDAILNFALIVGNHVKAQFDCTASAVGVLNSRDFLTDPGVDTELFLEFTAQGIPRLLALLDLSPGKLPFQGHHLVTRALADQDFAILQNQGRNDPFDLWAAALSVAHCLAFLHLLARSFQVCAHYGGAVLHQFAIFGREGSGKVTVDIEFANHASLNKDGNHDLRLGFR